MKFFGGQVFNLPIEEALKRKFLVNYYYHPIFVYATAIEEQNFEKQTQRIISCFRNKRCINPDELVKAFNNGDISALVAIKCLDEGINIPSITDALILSSNDDYREFVQRRGRILRLYGDKQCAHIYDVIVLPSPELKGWAEIEFRRYREYARLAINAEALLEQLNNEIATYDINEEDLDVYDYENMEVEADE